MNLWTLNLWSIHSLRILAPTSVVCTPYLRSVVRQEQTQVPRLRGLNLLEATLNSASRHQYRSSNTNILQHSELSTSQVHFIPQLLRANLSAHTKTLQQPTAVMTDAQLYDEQFSITSIDPGKYDRVARIAGTSTDNSTIITLDINTDLFPLAVGDGFHLLLASTLNLDGSKDEDLERGGWRENRGTASLADQFDYVCYGKVYKFEDGEDGEVM